MFHYLGLFNGLHLFRVKDNAINDVLMWYQHGAINRKNIEAFPPLNYLEIYLTNDESYQLTIGNKYYISIKKGNIEVPFGADKHVPRWYKPMRQTISTETINEIYKRQVKIIPIEEKEVKFDIEEDTIDHYTAKVTIEVEETSEDEEDEDEDEEEETL